MGKITTFKCDNCDKKQEAEEGFPYDKKWVYLHEFNFKNKKSRIIRSSEKHFCSTECMFEHFAKLTTAEVENEERR